jgi:hypothetical protein
MRGAARTARPAPVRQSKHRAVAMSRGTQLLMAEDL